MATKKILVVDDDLNMASLLSDILEVLHCQTKQAYDGEQALRLLKEEQYDMVITDVRMPKMSGINLLKVVKHNYPKLPVVLMTGFSLGTSGASGTSGTSQHILVTEQADAFLRKPFKVEDIEKLLKKLLKFPG